jgi:hypothetical protein
MNPTFKITAELAADIRARVKALDFAAIEKATKAKDQNGTFDVIISAEVIDRSGETVMQNGWELTNYKNNPIVLWGHDYFNLPIGVCTETYLTEYHGVPALGARGVFLSADINPLAQQVRRMYDYGIKSGYNVGCTTSVGFIPKERKEDNSAIITRQELLEFSFVPIPANQAVGPAAGRALTFTEAKEIGLDVAGMTRKGLEFVEKAECKGVEVCEDAACDHKGKKKEAEAGDHCTNDDGSPGILTSDPKDPDGPLVCLPQDQDKGFKDENGSKKKLLSAVGEEHDRHTDEVDKALEVFQKAVVEDQGNDPDEPNAKAKKATPETDMRENLKDFRDGLRDEHNMHRAKSVASFRSFDPSEGKAFDKNTHLKALRDAHDDYEGKNNKSLDEFEERCVKSVQGEPGEVDGHTDWITGKMEDNQRGHKKAVVKIAKAMCKAAFGEEDEPDVKTLEILKEFLTPHVDPQILTALTTKIGARMSAESKNKLGEAHEHLKAATAVVEALHGGLRDSDGEDGRSDGDNKSSATAPEKQRSRTAGVSATGELDAHMLGKEVLRGITTAASAALERIKAEERNKSNGRSSK